MEVYEQASFYAIVCRVPALKAGKLFATPRGERSLRADDRLFSPTKTNGKLQMKLSWKIFAVAAVAGAIAYGSSAKDRTRWMAALGMSQAKATELRIENARERFHAERAEQQARRRAPEQVQPAEQSPQGVVLSIEDVCKGLAEREAMLNAQGKDIEAAARRIKASCGADSARHAY